MSHHYKEGLFKFWQKKEKGHFQDMKIPRKVQYVKV